MSFKQKKISNMVWSGLGCREFLGYSEEIITSRAGTLKKGDDKEALLGVM